MVSKWKKEEKLSAKFSETLLFSIDVQTNLKEVDFLDVALNLQNFTYFPHKRPNHNLLYIHSSSHHPTQIIKQLPNSISERLSKKSYNQKIFNTVEVEYKDATVGL